MPLIALKPVIVAWLIWFCVHSVFHQSADAVCLAESWNTTYMRGRSCYEFKEEEKTWMEAYEYCHERLGRMPSITGAELQTWLSSTAARLWPQKNSVWLGLNRLSTDEVFVWDSYGTSADNARFYTNWAEGYPTSASIDGNCVLMNRYYDWRWTTSSCWGPFSFQSSFVCEYDNTEAPEAVITSSPNANTNTITFNYADHTDIQPDVHYKELLYLAVAAVTGVGVIIIVFVVFTIVDHTKSRATRPSKAADV